MKAPLPLLTIVAVLAAVGVSPLSTSPARAGTTLPVEGYLMADKAARSVIARNAAGITMVGVDGVVLTSRGNKLTTVPKAAKGMIAEAHSRRLKAELLVSNYSNSLGDFSTATAGRLLTSKKNRAAVVKSLVYKVKKRHFDGVQVDLESLKRSHGPGLTAFVKQLRAALPARKAISMAVMASERPSGYRNAGYQLDKLTKRIDRFVLMAYDQHGPGWSKAGPIGGTPWVKRVLAGFLAAPVPKAKIDLGVAEYAYRWRANSTRGSSMSVARARKLAGDRARYDTRQQEWTATLADGTVLWWSDATTFAARKTLAQQYQLHGLAVWELSLGDTIS
ncbi:MAG TPA: glycosyl hydrolase family 18 protein [Propionicimonas sp.]|nr:glycosyl hydrolase family 18 protein [Propionicimonas sp.]